MSTLLIEGGKRLSGAVAVEGNKNAALPLLAACLLTSDECVLHNVPRISDVEVMVRLLMDLGAGHACAFAQRHGHVDRRDVTVVGVIEGADDFRRVDAVTQID